MENITICEISSLVMVVGGFMSACLVCILKSRCSTIKCGCIKIERKVINDNELKNVSIVS